MDLLVVNSKDLLESLANESAITIEGIDLDEVNIFINFMVDEKILKRQPEEVYTWTGKFMNEICKLHGDNAYQDDFHFLAIGSKYNGDFAGSHPLKLKGEYRCLDDIIGNNACKEGYYPFESCKESLLRKASYLSKEF